MINELITQINDAIWGYVLIFALVMCVLWFTWKMKGVQFRMLREMFRLLDDYRAQKRNGVKDPIFHKSQLPEIEHQLECWD